MCTFYRPELTNLSNINHHFTMSLPVGVKSWDHAHNNPKAEVLLVSSDGVGFRVDSWYFAQKR